MADTRNADLTFGATDYLVYLAPLNTAAPTGVADPAAAWQCLGWVTTEGGVVKFDEESKDIEAAGSQEPIRTLMTKSTKSAQVTFLEGLNPLVRSLYDNVPVSALKPTTDVATYALPDKPADLRYAFLFDTMDGTKRVRLYAPNGKVTERGDEKPQTDDVMSVEMTFKFYKGAGNSAALSRTIKYGGIDMSSFFPTTSGS
ncbi:phage tail protein [Streptomyces varsoviensis]|uniref:phage tail tube protein n=1 Tax=Streptomyces varsoviensis TaxID=67373 RepID=UPI0033EC5A24